MYAVNLADVTFQTYINKMILGRKTCNKCFHNVSKYLDLGSEQIKWWLILVLIADLCFGVLSHVFIQKI